MSGGNGSGLKCVVAVPTMRSHAYIRGSLARIRDEIARLSGFEAELVVCVNGTQDEGRTVAEVERFAAESAALRVTLLEQKAPGKNHAINAMVRYGRSVEAEIIHFFDDDVRFEPGTLDANLRALASTAHRRPLPVLVGSHFIANTHSLAHFREREASVVKATQSWFWHHVFGVPFRLDSERPRFCSGQSMCTWLEAMPELPPDETNISDDAFLSNYCAVKCKDVYEREGFMPLIKPDGSIIYFDVSTSLQEWRRQQLRIYVGVANADDCFASDIAFLSQFFSWAFGFKPSFTRSARGMRPAKRLLRDIRRALLRPVLRDAETLRARNERVDWAVATSTKPTGVVGPASQLA